MAGPRPDVSGGECEFSAIVRTDCIALSEKPCTQVQIDIGGCFSWFRLCSFLEALGVIRWLTPKPKGVCLVRGVVNWEGVLKEGGESSKEITPGS